MAVLVDGSSNPERSLEGQIWRLKAQLELAAEDAEKQSLQAQIEKLEQIRDGLLTRGVVPRVPGWPPVKDNGAFDVDNAALFEETMGSQFEVNVGSKQKKDVNYLASPETFEPGIDPKVLRALALGIDPKLLKDL